MAATDLRLRGQSDVPQVNTNNIVDVNIGGFTTHASDGLYTTPGQTAGIIPNQYATGLVPNGTNSECKPAK
jgi:hypothetical protein